MLDNSAIFMIIQPCNRRLFTESQLLFHCLPDVKRQLLFYSITKKYLQHPPLLLTHLSTPQLSTALITTAVSSVASLHLSSVPIANLGKILLPKTRLLFCCSDCIARLLESFYWRPITSCNMLIILDFLSSILQYLNISPSLPYFLTYASQQSKRGYDTKHRPYIWYLKASTIEEN